MNRTEDLRHQAVKKLQEFEVLMRQGHFDYGNGFHGKLYLNPHKLLQWPSTIWRFAQDLIDVMPADFIDQERGEIGFRPRQVSDKLQKANDLGNSQCPALVVLVVLEALTNVVDVCASLIGQVALD